jgi:outer membrane receptor protein involved in Fe transport
VPFAYSSGLVGPNLVVTAEPVASEPFALVNEILGPHGLTLRTIAGVHLVVRMDRTDTSSPVSAGTDAGGSRPEIEMIVVSASRYEISRDISTSRFQLDRRSIQSMPDVGDDPIRITQRLPGAAASGTSARSHFRGGNTDEIGIMLNGQWLFDPYHVRDFQSVFSAIDSRAISGVEVYTGGFPARYGDRMSGLVLMESMEQDKPRHTEIGLSVFNTSVLTSGKTDDRRWLFSARRGNLDLIIDPKFGRPSYYDVFGEFALDLTSNTSLSVNALYADDRVQVVTETDPAELEQVSSDTRNAQFWLQLETSWSDSLASSTVLSATSYENLRSGSMSDPEKIIATVRDQRKVDQFSLRQDWTWSPSDRHFVQWGLQAIFGDAEYDYSGMAEYFGLQAIYEDQPPALTRELLAAPNGGSFSLYVSDRWRLTPKSTVEWGLRWDDQAYTGLNADAQISPRLNYLYALDQKTELRLTWGRYYQSQGIHELQVEDGIDAFWPAQRSDHIIAGMRRLLPGDFSLRVEAFYKYMSRVRPRFENLFDPLSIIPEFQADRVGLAPQSAQSTGLEISLDHSTGSWDWWGSYTLARATDRIDGRDEPRSWDQRHALQGGMTWSNQQWTVSVAGSLHSGWPTSDLALLEAGTDPDGEPIYIARPGQRNVLRHDFFASLDFRVSRTFDVRHGTLLAFLEVTNLTNRKNPCCRDWDITEDASGNTILEHSYDYWMPLLPAVGVLWEF